MEAVVLRTHLSKKPGPGAWLAAVYSLAVLMLAFVVYQQDPLGWGSLLSATPRQVFHEHQLWRAWTATLVHADLGHFMSNAFVFAGLAFLLYGYFGSVVFPLAAFGLGGIAHALALATYGSDVTLVGASGTIYLMMGAWLALYVGIDRRFTFSRRLLHGAGFALSLLIPSTSEPQVSDRAHAIGFAVGVLFGVVYFLWKKSELRRSEIVRITCSPEDLPSDPHWEDELPATSSEELWKSAHPE